MSFDPASPRGAALAPGCRPEAELLLRVTAPAALARPSGSTSTSSTGDGADARLAAEIEDPEFLVRSAVENRVVPSLHLAIESIDTVDSGLRSVVASLARAWTVRNLQLDAELGSALERMAKVGIPVLLYKGPILAQQYWDPPSARHYKDVDLFVPADRVRDAYEEFSRAGYVLDPERGDATVDSLIRTDCEIELLHPESRLQVELHWEVVDAANRLDLTASVLWDRARPTTIAGHVVALPAPEDLVLALCVHGGEKHHWNRLKWVADLAHILGRETKFDWDSLVDRASGFGRIETILVGLALADSLFGTTLPSDIRDRIDASPLVRSLAGIARGRMFGGENPGLRDWLAYVTDDDRRVGRDGRRPLGRWDYLRAINRPGWHERRALPLPRALHFLHYLFRPVRLIWRNGLAIFTRAR